MTIYSFSIITTTGYPFYFVQLHELPKVDLHLRFYDFSNIDIQQESLAESWELFAGLISALVEFGRILGNKLELLKFKPLKEEDLKGGTDRPRLIRNPIYPVEIPPGEDQNVLFITQNERFLSPVALETKINMIYYNVIEKGKKTPIGPDTSITEEEKKYIHDILENVAAVKKIDENSDKIKEKVLAVFKKYAPYGVKSIVITSFDYTPLVCYGKHTMEEIYCLLRDIGKMPEVSTYTWKIERGYIEKKPFSVWIINSGEGVRVDGVFCPYYYLIITSPDAIMGEAPGDIYNTINSAFD